MNVIPIIAKADTIARSELNQFKARVSGLGLGISAGTLYVKEFEVLRIGGRS